MSENGINIDKAIIVAPSREESVFKQGTRIALALLIGGGLTYAFNTRPERTPIPISPQSNESCEALIDKVLITRSWNSIKGIFLDFLAITIEDVNVNDLSLSGSANFGATLDLASICRTKHSYVLECYYGARLALDELRVLKALVEYSLSVSNNTQPAEQNKLLLIQNRITIYSTKLETALNDLDRNLLSQLCPRPTRGIAQSVTRTTVQQTRTSTTTCGPLGCITRYHYPTTR
ncbi:MAG: hypothetical protein KBC84_11275 [Proteobacteria bacterium]|nr:hypothetical protein [Pseudomonadota bacterium]